MRKLSARTPVKTDSSAKPPDAPTEPPESFSGGSVGLGGIIGHLEGKEASWGRSGASPVLKKTGRK